MRSSLLRSLVWSTLVVVLSATLFLLTPGGPTWGPAPAAAGPTTTIEPTTVPPTDPPTTVPPTDPPPTVPPTTSPPPPPPTSPTTFPSITVPPPQTLPTTTDPDATTTTATGDDGTTTTSTTESTSVPGLAVPGAGESGTDETTTTTTPGAGDDDGLSSSGKLAVAIGGLLGTAALIGLLSIVYFLKTRPIDDEEWDDSEWEPEGWADDGVMAEPVPAGIAASLMGGVAATDDAAGADDDTRPDVPIVRPSALPHRGEDMPAQGGQTPPPADASTSEGPADGDQVDDEAPPPASGETPEGGLAALTRLLEDLGPKEGSDGWDRLPDLGPQGPEADDSD